MPVPAAGADRSRARTLSEAKRALVSLRAVTGELRELARAHFVIGNRLMADRLDQIARAIAADVAAISGRSAPGPDRLTDHLDT